MSHSRILKLAAVTAIAAMVATAVETQAADIDYFRTDTPEFMASAKQGKQLFEAYQCALCHATREGQPLTKEIIAPNLILSKERLRPEWILEWIIDPQKLQPGTKMPNFFSFNTDDQDNNIYTDADAHTQFKMILALRDYIMILGTDKEAELQKVDDAGRPIASAAVERSEQGASRAAPAASPTQGGNAADGGAGDSAEDGAAAAPQAPSADPQAPVAQ